MNRLTIIVVIILCLPGCGTDETDDEQIDRAERLIRKLEQSRNRNFDELEWTIDDRLQASELQEPRQSAFDDRSEIAASPAPPKPAPGDSAPVPLVEEAPTLNERTFPATIPSPARTSLIQPPVIEPPVITSQETLDTDKPTVNLPRIFDGVVAMPELHDIYDQSDRSLELSLLETRLTRAIRLQELLEERSHQRMFGTAQHSCVPEELHRRLNVLQSIREQLLWNRRRLESLIETTRNRASD